MSLERKLVNALESKDEFKQKEVFEEIYYTYYNLVCFCIYQYVKNNKDIEEIANDVFLNFFNHLHEIEINNIKYYLTTVAKNLSLNFIRDNRKRNTIMLDDGLVLKQTDTSFDNRTTSIIDYLENLLSKEDYNLLYEHIVCEKKLKVIARELNIPYQTLKKRYIRIVQKVRREYQKNEK